MSSPSTSFPTSPRPTPSPRPRPSLPGTAVSPGSGNSAPVTPRAGQGRHRRHEGDTDTFPPVRLVDDAGRDVAPRGDADRSAVPVPVQGPERPAGVGLRWPLRLRGPGGPVERAEVVLRLEEHPCCRRVRVALGALCLAVALGAGIGLALVAFVTAPDWWELINDAIGAAG